MGCREPSYHQEGPAPVSEEDPTGLSLNQEGGPRAIRAPKPVAGRILLTGKWEEVTGAVPECQRPVHRGEALCPHTPKCASKGTEGPIWGSPHRRGVEVNQC